MKTESVTYNNFDEVVFENRNKEYGAYALRRSYHSNVNKGFSFTLLCIGVIAALYTVASYLTGGKVIPESPIKTIVTTLAKTPDIIKREPKVQPAVHHTSNHNVIPTPTADPVADEDIVLNDPTPITNTNGDDKASGSVDFGGDSGGSIDVGNNTGVEVKATVPTIFVTAEVMPAYKGGMEAMIKFLQRNLHYPAIARRMGIEGTVYVSFIVNAEGNVVQAQILKGISKECDDEAKRVIGIMPAWTPGQQNKAAVMVRMVLPINYKLNTF